MDKKQTLLCEYVDQARDLIVAAEKTIWENPELGFEEWETHAYMKAEFEKMGYIVVEFGNIPGFYADVDTGKPGPKVVLMGEMDALLQPTHPAAVNGNAHACGHHAQCAALMGAAYALKQPGAMDGLSGTVRLMAVPAEELGGSNLERRYQMHEEGLIHFSQGKPELMYRGLLDDADIAIMVHTTSGETHDFRCDGGCNAIMYKYATFRGRAVQSGSKQTPVNALYAANLAIDGINAIRETFPEDKCLKVNPRILDPNIACCKMRIGINAMDDATQEMVSQRIDQILLGAAIMMNSQLEISNDPACAALFHPAKLTEVSKKACADLVGEDRVKFQSYWNRGGADMGDVSWVIPSIHLNACGASGGVHTDKFCIGDIDRACVNSAKAQVLLVQSLLENDAKNAKEVMADFAPHAIPMQEYVAKKLARFTKKVTEFSTDDSGLQVTLKQQ